MYIPVIFLVCFISLTSGNSIFRRPRRIDGKIVGGVPVDIKDFPYQISLQSYNSHTCGGSIISEKYILTAAHCTYGSSASFDISAGSSSKIGVQKIHVKRIIEHPNFDYSKINYDFSILELEEPLKFNDNVRAVKLHGDGENLKVGENCTVSGWGYTQNLEESYDKLRATVVPIISQESCNEAYKSYGGVTDQMICAGYPEGGKDACQGDSGGPLIDSNGVLVGVVSWGHGCADPNFPGVYSRVASVREWIKTVSGV